MPTIQNIDLTPGSDAIWTIQMLPIQNITGFSLKFEAFPLGAPPTIGSAAFVLNNTCLPPWQAMQVGGVQQGPVITKDNGSIGGVNIVNAAQGIFTITINAADTINLAPGQYSWWIRRTDTGNSLPISNGYLYLGT